MESPTRPVLCPTKALNPVSPERMNQQTIPASPSLPSELLSLHHKNIKGVSEVQAKVAFLNSLARAGSPSAQAQAATNNAALQRAILGREEAESALTSAQEELSDAQSRERRISERLESLLEELHGTKERQAHERSIFEKEIRKARKEAFRAGSTLVKLQEELKHAKSETKALKDEVATEREAKDHAKQEAFERAYALAGLTEELEVLKGKLRSMEAANHSNKLEARAHEIRKEDFGRMSLAEGDLAFLTTPRRPKRAAADSIRSSAQEREPENFAEATPPKRLRLSEATSPVEEHVANVTAPTELESELIDELKDELYFERRQRVQAEEMVHFLNIECQFERCSCRVAEKEGRRFIYDVEYYEEFQKPQLEAEVKAAAQAEAAAQAKAEAQAKAVAQEAAAAQAKTEAAAQATAQAAAAVQAKAEAQAAAAAQAKVEAVAQANAQAQAEAEAQTAAEEDAARRAQKSYPAPDFSHTPSVEPPAPPPHRHGMDSEAKVKHEPTEPPEKMPMPEEPLVTFSPETGTFKTFPSPIRENARPPPRRADDFASPSLPYPPVRPRAEWRESSSSSGHVRSFTPIDEPKSSRMANHAPSEPALNEKTHTHTHTHNHASAEVRPTRTRERDDPHSQPTTTTTTTKRVPLREPNAPQNLSFLPDQPINREEALAQIRARRGRARSNVRSVSANEATGRSAGSAGSTAITPGRGPRRIPNLQTQSSRSENDVVERRDLSAPVRMFRR
ncbi:hypothetical protein N7466_001289 [Penicillium verhagenii]|uniref:uncharacterized protein n=1 Tax=Penicillium verhagenii TaxID=1562060 RepID=UPI002545A33B|nr:uncharacterized protein N7466_001289 [Penicillium verhagenii]KAJ5948274.1 hypothetical protein N7466_001289 [Penicillium verhagenii]